MMKGENKSAGRLAAVVLILLSASLTGCPIDVEPEEQLIFAAPEHFILEETGLPALKEKYDLEFDVVYEMAVGITHEALRAGDIDAALGYATDAKMKELDLVALEDDKSFFPAQNAAPLVREDVLQQHPEIELVLAKITPLLDNETMMHLNYLVDIEEKEPDAVARDWLVEKGLISEKMEKPEEDSPVIISSKGFTEHKTLTHITVLALKDAGIPVEKRPFLFAPGAIYSALLEGHIDLYWEYMGTALKEIYMREELIADPDQAYNLVAQKDAEKGILWLDYTPMNNTGVIMMRSEHAAELNINTISQFAEWAEQVRAGE